MTKRRQFTRREVAIAKGAMAAGIPATVVARCMGISANTLHNWNRGDGHTHVKPEPTFGARLRALFDLGPPDA